MFGWCGEMAQTHSIKIREKLFLYTKSDEEHKGKFGTNVWIYTDIYKGFKGRNENKIIQKMFFFYGSEDENENLKALIKESRQDI